MRNAIAHSGRLRPGVDLLPKPFSLSALATKMRGVLDRSRVERVLVRSHDSRKRLKLVIALERLGLSNDKAATVREALSCLRVAEGPTMS
jgi:DNA-binding response OmpR family regulator